MPPGAAAQTHSPNERTWAHRVTAGVLLWRFTACSQTKTSGLVSELKSSRSYSVMCLAVTVYRLKSCFVFFVCYLHKTSLYFKRVTRVKPARGARCTHTHTNCCLVESKVLPYWGNCRFFFFSFPQLVTSHLVYWLLASELCPPPLSLATVAG